MLKTSLIEILRTFSKEELKRFDEFVLSPYFNKKSTVTKLWKYISKFSPEYCDMNLDRKIVWNKLFPAKEFNYGVMKNLIYELTLLSERFLQEEVFAGNSYRRGYSFLLSVSARDLRKLFDSKYNALELKILNSERGHEKYEELVDLNWLKYSVFDISDTSKRNNIFQLSDYTVYSSLIGLFKMYNNVIADKLSSREMIANTLLEDFLKSIDLEHFIRKIKKYPDDYITLSIYYEMYKALSQTDISGSYFAFKRKFINNIDSFSNMEKGNLFACLYTSLTYNKAIKDKVTEFNGLTKIMHSKNLILDEDDSINIRNYSLGIRFAAMSKDFEFMEDFIRIYFDKLRPSAKENMKLYGDAFTYFSKKEFEKALELVNKINFDLITFKFELKTLQIILLYELGDYNSLQCSVDSYKHYAANNQFISESTRNNIFRFINYVILLFRQKENNDIAGMKLLRDEIKNESLNTKLWLLDKLDELHK